MACRPAAGGSHSAVQGHQLALEGQPSRCPFLLEVRMDALILKRAAASRLSGEWSEDDYDVLADGVVVGRIMKAAAAPVGQPWLWTLAFWHHEERAPICGYEPTREAAMAAFAKSWRRE